MGKSSQAGFSLLEALIGLVLISVVSLALFQSAAQWFHLSSRAAVSANRSMDRIALQRSLDIVIDGLTLAWPEQEAGVFLGRRSEFRGLSDGYLVRIAGEPRPVSLELRNQNGQLEIVYRMDRDELVIDRRSASDAALSYLGADMRWRDTWPPVTAPEPGPFEEYSRLGPPQLPEAIRLCVTEARGETCWVAGLPGTRPLPSRIQDLAGN